jgi:hypothetical protein
MSGFQLRREHQTPDSCSKGKETIMKNYISILFLCVFISLFSLPDLFSQHLTVETGQIMLDNEPSPALIVEMEPAPKEVKKEWHDYIKDRYDVDLKGIGFLSNKDVLSAEAVTIAAISSQPIDLYTRVIERAGLTEMSVYANFTDGNAISEDEAPETFGQIEGIVEDFLGVYLPDHYLNLVESTQEELDDLSDRRSDLREDIIDNEQEIDKLRKENAEKNAELEKVGRDIDRVKEMLETRKAKLSRIDRKIVEE